MRFFFVPKIVRKLQSNKDFFWWLQCLHCEDLIQFECKFDFLGYDFKKKSL